MNENEFWRLQCSRREEGKAPAITYGKMTGNKDLEGAVKYIEGHAYLPKDYDKVSRGEIIEMGKLLFSGGTKVKTKEAILILLAHQNSADALFFLEEYNKRPDRALEIFARLALDECMMWNE